MELARTSIMVGGALSLMIALGHTSFYRLMGWGDDFGKLTPLNRRVLYTIHVALELLLLLLGYVSLRYPDELSRPQGLGAGIAVGCALFWLWRLVWQIAYFHPKRLGVGRGMVGVHFGLIVLLVVMVVAYGAPSAANWLG